MILVIGATGTVGTQVVDQLSKKGAKFKVMSRSPEKAKKVAGGEFVQGDYTKPETLGPAMRGVEKLFLLTDASPDSTKYVQNILDAAKKAGVKHVVKLSVIGAEMEPGIAIGKMHREAEKLVEGSGMAWTHLRPGAFLTNWFSNGGSIKKDGAVYAPTGNGKIASIDPRDIGEVAAKALTEPGHEHRAYTLTGGEPLSYQEHLDLLGKVLGRPLKHVDVPPEAARDGMLKFGMPAWLVDGLLEFNAVIKAGHAAMVSPDVERVTGHKPRSVKAWFEENAAAFK